MQSFIPLNRQLKAHNLPVGVYACGHNLPPRLVNIKATHLAIEFIVANRFARQGEDVDKTSSIVLHPSFGQDVPDFIKRLLKEGTTMYAVYQDGEKKVLYTSDKTSVSVPVVLVTNSGTGYASEMFAIMLKDVADAKTVGTTTMGKGGLQKMFRLPDGSGVELTIAILNPVTSRVYNGTGIAADYEKTLDANQELTYVTMAPSEDPQIVRAFEVAENLSK